MWPLPAIVPLEADPGGAGRSVVNKVYKILNNRICNLKKDFF